MTCLVIISSLVILLSAFYYIFRAVVVATKSLFEYSRELYINEADKLLLSNIKIPVSIIIPPSEDYETLKRRVEHSLDINHPMFQVIVLVKKGGSYLNRMITDFNLVRLEAVYKMVLKSANVLHTYRSVKDKRLSVIVADTLDTASVINLGFDVAMYPFVCLLSEDYIPSKDLLLILEPPVISNEGINFGSITSASSYENTTVSRYFIQTIYAYSNMFSFSIPSDFAILVKKRFIVEQKGLVKGEDIPSFLRRMIRRGLRLIFTQEAGFSAEKKGILFTFISHHLRNIVCGRKLSALAVLLNCLYYISFIVLNVNLFYLLFSNRQDISIILTTAMLIFVIVPLKDIMILISEGFVKKRVENPYIVKAVLLSIFKEFGVEQVIAIMFVFYSLKRAFGLRGVR